MADTTKYVNWDGLAHYDKKIKEHITDTVLELEAKTATKEQVRTISADVQQLKIDVSNESIRIQNLDKRLITAEAELSTLESKTNAINTTLARVETAQDTMVKRHELSDYAKSEQVDKQIADAVRAATVDLTDYYKKGDVDARIANLRNEVVENTTNVDNIIETVNTVQDATMRDHELLETLMTSVENKSEEGHKHNLSDIIDYTAPNLSIYATKEFVEQEVAAIEQPNLDGYAKREEIPDVSSFASRDYVAAEIAKIPPIDVSNKVDKQDYLADKATFATKESIQDLASEDFVRAEVAEALREQDVDFSNYYTKSEVDALVPVLPRNVSAFNNDAGYITAIPSNYVTDADLDDYVEDRSLATKQFVQSEIAKAELGGSGSVDVSVFYTKAETDAKLAGKVDSTTYQVDKANYAADKATFATTASVDAKIAEQEVRFKDYDTSVQVDAKIVLATKDFVTTDQLDSYVSDRELEIVSNSVTDLDEKIDKQADTLRSVQNSIQDQEDAIDALAASLDEKVDETALDGLATETFVKNAIAEAELNDKDVDLSGYATKDDLKNYTTTQDLPDFSKFLTKVPSEYITEEELQAELEKIEQSEVDLEGYATESWVSSQGFAKTSDLTDYAKKTELPTDYLVADDLKSYAKKSELPIVPENISEFTNDAKYTTLDAVSRVGYITNSALEGYATEGWVNSQGFAKTESIPKDYLTDEDIKDFIKMSDVEDKGYLTQQSLTDYVKKDDVSNFITLTDVETAGYIKNIPEEYVTSGELEDYATKQYVTETIAGLEQPEVDLSNYYTKEETYTKGQVDAAIANIEHPDIPTKVSDLDNDAKYTTLEAVAQVGYITNVDDKLDKSVYDTEKTAFAAKTDLDNYYDKTTVDKKFEEIEHPTVDLEGYATESWVNDQGFLKEHQSLDEYAKLTDIPDTSKFITEVPSEYITETELDNKGYLTEHQSLEGYAKTTDIPDVSNFVTMSQVEAKGYITEVPEEYVTSSELEAEGFLKEHQDLSDYAKKTDIPSLTGYATEQYVEGALTDALSTKANNIVFTEDMRVGTALGQFVENESLKDLTLAQILTKLLNLTVYVPPTPDIELPESTPDIVVEIVAAKEPAYTLAEDGSIVEVTDQEDYYRELTPQEAVVDNQEESFFYQIVDNTTGQVVESGYQIATIYQENDYLTVLIPNSITKFHVEEYSALAGDWSEPTWKLVENPNYSVEGHTAYTVPEEYGVMSGISVRIVIEE